VDSPNNLDLERRLLADLRWNVSANSAFWLVCGDGFVSLEDAEDMHRDVCVLRPESPVRNMLL